MAADYATAPIRYFWVSQTAHTPRVAGEPFFMVVASTFLVWVCCLHFSQYIMTALVCAVFPLVLLDALLRVLVFAGIGRHLRWGLASFYNTGFGVAVKAVSVGPRRR